MQFVDATSAVRLFPKAANPQQFFAAVLSATGKLTDETLGRSIEFP
jgi:hypothetical protein